MNCYETLFVIKPTLTEEETKAQIERMKEVLTKVDADLQAINEMGMRKLAYPVQKNERGYYVVMYYKAPGSAIAEIERNLRINEDILKFLTVRYYNHKEIAQFEKQVAAAKGGAQPKEESAEA
jgi:small subunit ribosomal protein S6